MCNLQNCDLLFPMTFSSSSALFSASSNVLAGALVSAITVQNAQKCPNRVSEESFKLIWESLKLSRSLSSSPGVSQAHQGVFYQGILWVQSRERGERRRLFCSREVVAVVHRLVWLHVGVARVSCKDHPVWFCGRGEALLHS